MGGNRSYSDPSYGAHKTITLAGNVGLHTAASLASALGHTCLYPCKVLDCNITFPLGLAGDLGTSTSATLASLRIRASM